MDIPDTRLMLEQVRQFDHRDITDRLVTDWQHALARLTVEHVFDAIHDHYERCASAHTVALTPAEILQHERVRRERTEAEERRQRALERNENVFDRLHDQRTTTEREASIRAMRAGRQHLDQILANRTPGDNRTEGVGAGAH